MPTTDYFLPRPPEDASPEREVKFEDLFRSTPLGATVDYHLPYPRWQYLSWLCKTKELVLHGSQNTAIAVVEPRQAADVRAFSNQEAIYATTDGIWVIYFAIVDRKKFTGLSLFNSCVQIRLSADQWSDPYYFFSISQFAKVQKPWCQGMVYILPRQDFEQEGQQQMEGMEISFPHWISRVAAQPVARLGVGPQDFPFLDQIHGHDDEKLEQLFRSDPGGFPAGALIDQD